MKAWGKIRSKRFFSSKPTSEAVTPVIGSIIMLLILFALAGVATVNFFNNAEGGATPQSPVVRISLESCEGGLRYAPQGENSTFENNTIVLIHEGGSPLPLDATCIKILGNGNAFQGDVGKGGIFLTGSTETIYQNLSPIEKSSRYKSQNKEVLNDNFWGVGEKLTLHGDDSAIGSIISSVKVSVNGDSNTSDNYGFKAGSEITIKVIDIKNNNVIAEQKDIVKTVK